MHKLLKVPFKTLVIIAVIVILTIVSVGFVLFYQVEDSFHTTVKVGNQAGSGIMVNSRQMYRLNHGTQITIRIKHEYYTGIIGKITQVDHKDLFNLHTTWKGSMPKIINGTSFDAVIVIGKHTVLDALLHSSV